MVKFKQYPGPFQKSKRSNEQIMKTLFLALLPLIIFSFVKNGLMP